MEKIEIPKNTVYRLSIYQRCLQRFSEQKTETVSSEALAKAAGVKSTQLRKDLGYVGQYGTRGLGYDVGTLSGAISGAMGMTRLQPVVLIGVGNLGAALLHHSGFRKEGFEIIAAFDMAPDQVAIRNSDLDVPVHHVDGLGKYMKSHEVKMAILAVPESGAQSVVDIMVEAGVEAILNFSPTVLKVPENVVVNGVDLVAELESLRYFVS